MASLLLWTTSLPAGIRCENAIALNDHRTSWSIAVRMDKTSCFPRTAGPFAPYLDDPRLAIGTLHARRQDAWGWGCGLGTRTGGLSDEPSGRPHAQCQPA